MSEPALFEPEPGQVESLLPMLDMLERHPASLSSVKGRGEAIEVHLLDSLSGTLVPELRNAGSIVDIGSGAGFPGIPLAVALPRTRVHLVESVGRKADFIGSVISRLGLENAPVSNARSEEIAAAEGREAYQAATARAVAPLAVLAELASPLLEADGALVAWKGRRDAGEEAQLSDVAERVAMRTERVMPVRPFAQSRIRHLYVLRKTGATPAGLPRRPGMARKRPLTG